MKIVSLLENVSVVPELKAKHGLSLYIECGGHKILFDLGPDKTFLKNAEKLGIDIAAVDTVIISHGHYDHGGGLEAFLSANEKAKIYIRVDAFEPYYARVLFFRKFIGLDLPLSQENRIVFTGKHCVIDKGIELFSDVTEREFFSSANKSLRKMDEHRLVKDDFSHEQYLVLTEGEQQLLITGCSHNGIVNIINKYEKLYKVGACCTVIGGFHLYNPTRRKYESNRNIRAIADRLNKTGYRFYTCHCTGIDAVKLMKEKMNDRLEYLSTGKKLIF